MEEGDAEKAAWQRRPCQRDGQPSRALAPAHTHAHSHTRSYPRHCAIAGVPSTLRRTPQAGTYSCHLQRWQLSPSQQQPPPPLAASSSSHPSAWVRAGRPSPPPSALLTVFTTFPPGQWRTPGDEPEGAGRGGVHASPAFFLQRTLYMVVRGRAKEAPALWRLPRRLRLQYSPRSLCSGDPRAGIPPPLSPHQARCCRRRSSN